MASTTKHNATLLTPGLAGNEILVNEALTRLEVKEVKDRDLLTPPGSPTNGDAYLVSTSGTATGDWTGMEGKVTVYLDGWLFFTPYEGFKLWVEDEDLDLMLINGEPVSASGLNTLTDGATIAWDHGMGTFAQVTLGGNRTLLNPSFTRVSMTYNLRVQQDGIGSRTLAYGSKYEFPGGTAPTLSTGVNAVDLLTFMADGNKDLILISSALNVS